jgi:hypothetical protein
MAIFRHQAEKLNPQLVLKRSSRVKGKDAKTEEQKRKQYMEHEEERLRKAEELEAARLRKAEIIKEAEDQRAMAELADSAITAEELAAAVAEIERVKEVERQRDRDQRRNRKKRRDEETVHLQAYDAVKNSWNEKLVRSAALS